MNFDEFNDVVPRFFDRTQAESLELPVDVVPVGKVLELETRQQFSRPECLLPTSRGEGPLRRDQPSFAGRTVMAVPVGAPDRCERLRNRVDHFVCLETPEPFFGIAYWYTHFPSVDEREVTHTVTQTQWSPLALA